jgi:hypothetical protein
LLARRQMPMPFAQCIDGLVDGGELQCFCLSATMTLMQSVERRQWSATPEQVLASGGR